MKWKMSIKTSKGSAVVSVKILSALLAAAIPAAVSAAWQTVAVEQGKQVQIDRESITQGQGSAMTAKGRIVLDKPITDPKTSVAYRFIEIESRYDCAERTYATLKRIYYREEGEIVREEEVRSPFEMPVRSGTPDYRLFREACRPKGGASEPQNVNGTLDKINEVSGDLRKANEALVEKAVREDLQRLTRQPAPASSSRAPAPASKGRPSSAARAPAQPAPKAAWSYEGDGNPSLWGRLRPEYATCATGRRQSPIDLRHGIAVDLEPIQFFYQPSAYRVIDSVRQLQLAIYGGGLMVMGKQYRLTRIHLHHPAEFTINGQSFDMEAQLLHQADDGKTAIVSVLLEQGTENPVIQAALNNLPLESGGEVAPPGQAIDVSQLLPASKNYYTFMGSLTQPPCTEDVLWMVLKQPQQVSLEQLSILRRLYRPNARPVQPAFGRIIKESR